MQAEQSFMTFEGTQIQGSAKIGEKLTVSFFFHFTGNIYAFLYANRFRNGHFFLQSLTFQKINRAITTIDAQPTFDGGVLINVLGRLQVSNKT